MKIWSLIMISALVGSSALSQPAAAQFDLLCKGERVGDGAALFNTRYRIDLASKRWCWEECEGTRDIASFSASEIVLEKGMFRPTIYKSTVINRQTGGLFVDYKSDIINFTEIGTCDVAKFSGFPANKF